MEIGALDYSAGGGWAPADHVRFLGGRVVIVQKAYMASTLTMTFVIVLSSSSVGLNSMSRGPPLSSGTGPGGV